MPMLSYVEVDGHRLAYQAHGCADPDRAAGPPLVLVHGAGGMVMNWPPQLRRLRGRIVYTLDLPGHGESQGSGKRSIAGYRAIVAAFADQLALPRFVAAGHSMGGAVALDLALHCPDRLAGLVLLGTSARLPVGRRLLDGLADQYAETIPWLVDLLFAPNVDPRLKTALLAHLSGQDPATLLGDFLACNAFDLSQRIGAIRLPTLIICGASDRMTPPVASEALYEQIPDSRLLIVEQAGHMVMLEQPAAVAQAVDAFLAHVADYAQTGSNIMEQRNPNG